MELWDEEMRRRRARRGIFTLPEMELPFGEMEPLSTKSARRRTRSSARGKFLVALGGEHSITPPLVSAAAAQVSRLSVLQIDAHADLRESYMGTRHNHACAMRRTLEYARVTQVGIRSLSSEEADVIPRLNTTIFYDVSMREDPAWIDAIVASLEPDVYVSIDVDGLDPAIMPATGTPEPGGLSWTEVTRLLRTTAGSDASSRAIWWSSSPSPAWWRRTFLCAKLLYKLFTYCFANDPRSRRAGV